VKAQIKNEIGRIVTSSKLVVLGEVHNYKANIEVKLALIHHLKKNNNLKYLILEHSHAGAMLYNKYLETGDTSLVCQDFYFNSTPSRRNFWKDLYEINRVAKEKLIVLGLDHDRSYPFIKTLHFILSDTQTNDKALTKVKADCKQFLETVSDPTKTDLELYSNIKNEFNKYFSSNEESHLKEVFGFHFIYISLIYSNQHSKDRGRKTNKKWVDNLYRIIDKKDLNIDEYSFFGMFGAAHCSSNKTSFSSIAFHSQGVFRQNVSTIMLHYVKNEKNGSELSSKKRRSFKICLVH
jgi:hypothetical protein